MLFSASLEAFCILRSLLYCLLELAVSMPPSRRQTQSAHPPLCSSSRRPGGCLSCGSSLKSLQQFLAAVNTGNYSYRALSPEERKALYRRCGIDPHNMSVTGRRSKHCYHFIDGETYLRQAEMTFCSCGAGNAIVVS